MIEDIVVSDTNIFIDLLTVELLDAFFRLQYRVWTTVRYGAFLAITDIKNGKEAREALNMIQSLEELIVSLRSALSCSLVFNFQHCLE